MLITGVNNINKICSEKPAFVSFTKKQHKKPVDTFEKQKEPYCVENSVDDFSFELSKLIEQKSCDKDNLKKLIRKYVPRTKVNDDKLLLFINNASAMFRYRHTVSNNNKMHCSQKIIVLDLNKSDENQTDFFNDLVHEMTHNLQTNKEKRVKDKIYKDFFEDTLESHSSYLNLSKNALWHGEDMISEYYDKKLGVIKFIEKRNYANKKWKYIDKFAKPEERAEAGQAYDLNVLLTLTREEQAYNVADEMSSKYLGAKVNQRKSARRQRMFNNLKEIVIDNLKNEGMDEEKIKEYKDLICG